ncbi:hypothetical protein GGF48_005270 [Coemansia sp. RSA 921]|nr:hypothetical protein GGF48_005270 [Coemansia sp. RSA 921]
MDERTQQDLVTASLPFRTGNDLVQLCNHESLSIAEVVFLNELQWRSREEVISAAYRIWNVMDDSIKRGCLSTSVKLPGRLNVNRRAPRLYQNLMRGFYSPPDQDMLSGPHNSAISDGTAAPFTRPSILETSLTMMQRNELNGVFRKKQRSRRPHLPHLDYLSVYAIAVNEENAAGGRVVTAPTNGAAGVIPAVLKYYLEFLSEDPSRDILEFLFTASAIGMLYKRGASISAAEMGCQGEIPCIERNALGAVKAVTAAQLALQGDGSHRVSLDQVIETMRQTGQDMMSKYKETSQGGLAVNVPVC